VLAVGTADRRVAWRTIPPGAVLLLAGVVFLLLRVGRAPTIYDEGLILAGADRILQGEVPYRDFWNTHPPAQIWLVAGLFRAFGESMMVLRVYDAAVKVCLALAVFGWAARLAPRGMAVAAFAVALAWLEYYGLFGYTAFPALLLGLMSLALVVSGLDTTRAARGRWAMFGAGLVAGAGSLFRLDFGAYTVAASATLIAVAHVIGSDAPMGGRLRRAVGSMAMFAGGAVVPTLAAVLSLLAQNVTLSRFLAIVVTYPLTTFAEVRRVPTPGFSARALAYYVPTWVGVAGLARGLLLMRRRTPGDATAFAWCGLSLLLLATLPQARTRVDLTHQAPILLPSVALAVGLWYGFWRRGTACRVAAYLLVPVLALTYLAVPIGARLRADARPVTAKAGHGLPRAAGIALEPDQVAAVRAVQGLTEPGDFVFVGAGRHDRVWGNDALFCFLAGRRYPTAYHNLLPGVATREDVQREIVSDLRRHDTRCVVRCTRFDAMAEPNASSRRSGSRILDEYLQREYTLSATMGDYEVWTR